MRKSNIVTGIQTYDLEYFKSFSDSRIKAVALCAEVGLLMYKIHHSLVVADAALLIAEEVKKQVKADLNMDVIEIGAILHDIGISQINMDNMPEHAYIGGEIARAAGYSEEVARCIERHDGAGFVKEFVLALNLPRSVEKDDMLPETWVEKIVAYADLIISIEAEAQLDFWNDDYSAAKLYYPYLAELYKNRLGLRFPKNHPQFDYIIEFNKCMRRFAPKEKYEARLRVQINRMVDSIRSFGLQIPCNSLKQW